MYEDKAGGAAIEGTLAHALAEKCLRENKDPLEYLGKEFDEVEGMKVNIDMVHHVRGYIEYIGDIFCDADFDSELIIESKVKYDEYVEGGFGTADCLILGEEWHIIDFKYGRVYVGARENPQLSLYALGCYQQYKDLPKPKAIHLHVYQPRKANKSRWTTDLDYILEFGRLAKEKSELALSSNPPYKASVEACKYCPHKMNCEEFKNEAFDKPMKIVDKLNRGEKLTKEEMLNLIKSKLLFKSAEKAVSDEILSMYDNGEEFEGVEVQTRTPYINWKFGRLETIEKLEALGLNPYSDKANAKLITPISARNKYGFEIIDPLTVMTANRVVVATT